MAESKQKIEKKVTDTILERPLTVKIGTKTYDVAPPSVATLILASEAVSRLPSYALDSQKVVQECFSIARHCRVLGEICAVLILGAQRSERRAKGFQRGGKRGLWCFLPRRRREKEILTDEILENLSPSAMFQLLSKILTTMQLSDFFGLTTFLTEINLLHQTREVETGTTASGQ